MSQKHSLHDNLFSFNKIKRDPELLEKRLLFREKNTAFTHEQLFYLDILKKGFLPLQTPSFPNGIPITIALMKKNNLEIPKTFGNLPNDTLSNVWKSIPLSVNDFTDDFSYITKIIKQSRYLELKYQLFVSKKTTRHEEDINYANMRNLHKNFFYFLNDGLTPRRIKMLADLALFGIRNAIATHGTAVFVDFGPGLYALEKELIKKMHYEERKSTTIIVVDVSEDLGRYGITSGYADQAYIMDISNKSYKEFLKLIPVANVIVYAEILEHIDHDGVVISKHVLPWWKETKAMIIGSVPNAIQLPEFIPLLSGIGSPHQLRRPIIDESNDHHSHHTFSTLSELLLEVWNFKFAGIISNGVRIQKDGNDADLTAGLESPQLGDRLIFWASDKMGRH